MNIIWSANPGPQTWVLQKNEKEILFGGQRGGGKTDALMVWLAEPTGEFPNYQGLVLRRNFKDLSDWIERAKLLYRPIGGVYVNDAFKFKKGGLIKTGHLMEESAYEKYQGHEYQRMGIEELTHIPTLELYLKVLGSNRSTIDGLKPQFMGNANPGGPGHRWVKKRFVDTSTLYDREYTDIQGKKHTVKHGKRWTDPNNPLLTRIFVPSRVEDNPYLFVKDPSYVAYLDSLPEELYKAWRLGDWETYEVKGSYYAQELALMTQQGRITKVPYDSAVVVDTWWDLGNPENTAVGFFQQAGMEWHMIDFYIGGSGGIKNYVQMLKDKQQLYGYIYGEHYAPHDIEVKEFTTGVTRIETARSLGIDFRIVPKNSLADGIDATRNIFSRLWIDEDKCEYFLDAIRNYKKRWNEHLAQFENEPENDWASHPADMLRYFAVSNVSPEVKRIERLRQTRLKESFDPYSIFK